MEILKATVLVGSGTDQIYLQTNLPAPVWPFTEKLSLRFEAAKGDGVAYVREHFKLEPEVIKMAGD